MIPYPGTAASRIRSRSGRPVNYLALRRSPAGVRSLRAGRSYRGFGPAPVHGRGATFVAVASSCPNSARRVATPPWTDSGGPRHSRFNCRCPRCGPDIRGRFTCAPPRQDVCLPRLARLGMSGFGKKVWARPRRQHHAHRDPPFVVGFCARALPARMVRGTPFRAILPTLLARFRSLVEGGASASNQVTVPGRPPPNAG